MIDGASPMPADERDAAGPDDGLEPVERLAEEYLARLRRGERPKVEDYLARHPELSGQIRDLFSALVLVEDLKPRSREIEAAGRREGIGLGRGGTPIERLGDFRIIREVGRGGMGIVYEAEQESLDRRVALKVLAPWALANPQTILRFNRESR